MTTYIAITDNHGDCQTYLTDTAEQRAEARAALRALNEPFAPVWAGEPDGAGDSHRNGEVLYADEPAAERAATEWTVSDDCGGRWPATITAADAECALDAAEAQVHRTRASYEGAVTVRVTVADDEGSHSREIALD